MTKIIEVVLNEPNKVIKISVPKGSKSVSFQTRRMPVAQPKGERPRSVPRKGVPEDRPVEVPVLYLEVSSEQNNRAKVDTGDEVRQFIISNTDEDVSSLILVGNTSRYIGTTQLYEGSVVLHLFEVFKHV